MVSPDDKFLRHRIAELRQAVGLNQGELARLCGMARAYIGLIENGARLEIGVSKLVALSCVLGVSLDRLVFGLGNIDEGAIRRAVERARQDPGAVSLTVDRVLGPRPGPTPRLRRRGKDTLAKRRTTPTIAKARPRSLRASPEARS